MNFFAAIQGAVCTVVALQDQRPPQVSSHGNLAQTSCDLLCVHKLIAKLGFVPKDSILYVHIQPLLKQKQVMIALRLN